MEDDEESADDEEANADDGADGAREQAVKETRNLSTESRRIRYYTGNLAKRREKCAYKESNGEEIGRVF